MTSYKNILLIAFLLAAVFAGCKDRWEEHIQVSGAALNGNVLEQISGNPNLSTFYGFLKETGYDATLTGARAFTVWAPTNEALQSIDQGIVKSPERLKQFVANHISHQQYYTHSALKDTARIETLSGKYIFWGDASAKVLGESEGAEPQRNIATSNGVVHLISEPFTPRPNSYEYLLSSEHGAQQSAFIQSLQGFRFIDTLAPQIGVNPNTGQPIYDTLAGLVPFNAFFHRGYDISDEDSLNTFIILTDEAYSAEVAKFRKYYNVGNEDSTIRFTSLGVVKDLVFRGLYTPEKLGSTLLYSKDSVQVQINEGDIVHVERTSNGIVYVLDNINISPENKLKPIRIEGEVIYEYGLDAELRLSHPEKAGSIRPRLRKHPQSKKPFYDILAYNHGVSAFNIRYWLNNVNTTTYDVYITTSNDFNGGTNYQQKVAFKDPTSEELPYFQVPAGEYRRIHVGRYTVDKYGTLEMFLVAAGSTRAAENPLNMDYVELVPVVE